MKEQFLPIEGYGDYIEARYEISNFGRVRSLYEGRMGRKTKNLDGILTSHVKPTGALYASLLTGEEFPRLKSIYISLLVAQHFVPNPEPGILTMVGYIDGDQKNVRADNLKWIKEELNYRGPARYDYRYEWISKNGVFVFKNKNEFKAFHEEMYNKKEIEIRFQTAWRGIKDSSGAYLKTTKTRKKNV